MKNTFLKSTIILLIGGFITKILGMIIKIVTNRLLGSVGLGIYMLITPTFMLLITIAQLGFPIAISKLVAEEKFKSEFLPQYKYELRNNIITHFGYYFKQAKGKYILKKNYKGIMEQSIKSTINPICLEYPDSYLIGNQKIYKDQYYGITEEFITKQCAKVGEEVLEEFGIK